MPESMKKIKLRDLGGARVVDSDGVEVRFPKEREQPPNPPATQQEKFEGLDRLALSISELAKSSRAESIAAISALIETQKEVVAAISGQARPKTLERVSIKVRREAGQIVDMTATPEYRK